MKIEVSKLVHKILYVLPKDLNIRNWSCPVYEFEYNSFLKVVSEGETPELSEAKYQRLNFQRNRYNEWELIL